MSGTFVCCASCMQVLHAQHGTAACLVLYQCHTACMSAVTKHLMLQLDRQVQEVLGLLENAQGFRQVTNAQRGIAARKVVHQVLHSLQRLGGAFAGVLPAEEHARAAGHVLQAVLQSVVGKS